MDPSQTTMRARFPLPPRWPSPVVIYAWIVLWGWHPTPAATLHVWQASPNPTPPYASWETAATGIQPAVDAAAAGDLVLVTNGVYATGGRTVGTNGLVNRVVVDKSVVLRSVHGPESTRIEGARAAGTAGGNGPNGDGAVRCIYLAEGAILSGFTLTNGATRLYRHDSASDWIGGGAWCASTNAVLTNCVVTGNSADGAGGGVASGTLFHCTLENNSVTGGDGGGAVWATLTNCVLVGNLAGEGAGASQSILDNCILSRNVAGPGGGGGALFSILRDCTLTDNFAPAGNGTFVYDHSNGGGANNSTLYHCTLTGNSATRGGGAWMSSLHNCALNGNAASVSGGGSEGGSLVHCTVTGNSAGTRDPVTELYRWPEGLVISPSEEGAGGGVRGGEIVNSIVFFNQASKGPNHEVAAFEYSCSTPLPPGPGNIATEPGFIREGGGFRLRPGSPCIDAGTNLVDIVVTDLQGVPRRLDGDGDGSAHVDMGAFEFDPAVLRFLGAEATSLGMRLEWEAGAIGAELQYSDTLVTPRWRGVTGSEKVSNLTVPAGDRMGFFRLRSPTRTVPR